MKINLFISLVLVAFVSFGQNPIEINYVKNQDNSVSFYYKKIVPGSYLVQVYFEDLTNTRAANAVLLCFWLVGKHDFQSKHKTKGYDIVTENN